MQDQITVVIPCYNEEKYIGRTIRHIYRQLDSKGIRIIVADAGSTDGTIEKINGLRENLDIRIDVIPGGLPSVGRNEGAKLATTPYILFVDADVTFTSKDVIRKSLDEMLTGNYDMVGTTPKYKGEKDRRAEMMFSVNRLSTWVLSKTMPFAIGGFVLISKSKFDELGGYDVNAKQSEDWLLSRKIDKKRFKLIFNLMTQDNRRFKKYGYLNMLKLIFRNWLNRNNSNYFYNAQNYWD